MRGLFAGLAGLLCAVAANAADIAVLPVGLSLDAGHDRAAITVTNQGQESVVMHVETVSWQQAEGQDQYAPTRDLLVNPPIFTLAPGRAQVLRIGLRQPPSGERETAYRLLLREVPPTGTAAAADSGADQGRVRVLLQLRLPVYVAPARIVRDQQWRGRRTADGAVAVTASNTGTVHLVASELKLRPGGAASDAAPIAALQTSATVFPGQSRTWTLPPQTAMTGQHFTLEVTTDQGTRHVALDLGQP